MKFELIKDIKTVSMSNDYINSLINVLTVQLPKNFGWNYDLIVI